MNKKEIMKYQNALDGLEFELLGKIMSNDNEIIRFIETLQELIDKLREEEKKYELKENKIKRLLKGIDYNTKYLVEFDIVGNVIKVVELEDEYMAGSKVYIERW